MGLFSSKDRSAEAMLNLQREQIATAKAEKDAKDQRILAAIGQIKGLFDPQKVMGWKKGTLDLSGLGYNQASQNYLAAGASPNDPALGYDAPKGYSLRKSQKANQGVAAQAGGGLGGSIAGGGSDHMTSLGGNAGGFYRDIGGEYGGNAQEWVPTAGATGGGMSDLYELLDAQGNVVGSGGSLEALKGQTIQGDVEYDTGETTGGFDKLITDFRDKYLGTLTGEINDKAELVRKDLLFALDRAGLMGGTPVDEKLGLWDKQKKDALTAAGVQADSAAGDYEDRVNAEKESLISQVFATEGQGDTASIAAAATQALQNMPQPTTGAQIGFDLGNIGQTYAQGYGVGNANYWNQQRSLKPSSPTQGSGGYTVV